MELVHLTIQQMIVMLLYLLSGFCLFKTGVVTEEGSKALAAMLIKLIIPMVIVNSFCIPFSLASLLALGQSTLLSAMLLLLAIILARWIYPHAPLENFGAAFSNAGFMGIPLVASVLGSSAVLYAAPFVAMLNLLQWTYGVDTICGRRSCITTRQLLWNPPMVGIALGMILFGTGLGETLPVPIVSTIQGICGLNGPLAMMVLGVYLARENPITLFTSRSLYGISAVRLILIPAVSLFALWALPISSTVALTLLICAAAPVGANVAVYAQLHGKDYAYASKIVVLSTLLSLVSLPLVVAAGQMIL